MKDLFTTRYARIITLGLISGTLFYIDYYTFKNVQIFNFLSHLYGGSAGCILAILFAAKANRDILGLRQRY